MHGVLPPGERKNRALRELEKSANGAASRVGRGEGTVTATRRGHVATRDLWSTMSVDP